MLILKNQVNKILFNPSFFPNGYVPREIQKTLINEIEQAFDSGYANVVLSAPTGIGKSLIAAYLANRYENAHIVTSQKNLQDQYAKDLKLLKPVKGKSNFACYQLMDEHKIDLTETKFAMDNDWTCEHGVCEKKVKIDNKMTTEICKYKPKLYDFNSSNNELNCLYYDQKFKGLYSKIPLWNYASFFQLIEYGSTVYAQYINRNIGIFDEAHRIEDEITNFIEIRITAKNLEDCKISLDKRNIEDIGVVIEILDELVECHAQKLRELEERETEKTEKFVDPGFSSSGTNLSTQYVKLEKNYHRFFEAKNEILSNKNNFLVTGNTHLEGKNKAITIKPIKLSNYAKKFFSNPKQLFMSATISKTLFCENFGFAPSEVAMIETPRSPFPLENRKVEFLNVISLSKNKPENEKIVFTKIDQILSNHRNSRGLILTSSKFRCAQIKKNLSPANQKRIRICHSNDNEFNKTQDEILIEHANDPAGVLLSSSLWEGVDLKDELSRFQIIAKTPYPDLADKMVKRKNELYPNWFNGKTIEKLLQGFGRSIRSEQDKAITYVLDSNAQTLLLKNLNLVPKAFHDLLN